MVSQQCCQLWEMTANVTGFQGSTPDLLSLSALTLALSACMGGGQAKGGLRGGMKAGGDTGKGERHSEALC